MKTILLASLTLAPFSAPIVSAQTPSTTPSAAPLLGGVAIPGLCMISRPAALASSKVGMAATVRLQQLAKQAQAEVDSERSALQADAQAFQSSQAKMSATDRDQHQNALATRARALQQTAALRGREIEATREKAMARIVVEMQPVVAQAYKARGCGLLIDRGPVLGGNLANDLTAAAVQGLDARITTSNFDLETLPI